MPLRLLLEDVEQDIERWLAIHGTEDTLSDGQVCVRGYDAAKAFVVNLYFENGRLKELLLFALKGYKDAAFLERLTEQLILQKNTLQFKRLWAYITDEQRMTYWQVLSTSEFFPGSDGLGNSFTAAEARDKHINVDIPEHRRVTVELLRHYEKILSSVNPIDKELPLLREEIELIASGASRKVMKKAITDRIDEQRFWYLIDQARCLQEEAEAQAYELVLLLEQYSGTQIKNFQKIFCQKLDQLNRWEVWALAYLAQNGCSDDAFEAFRAWIVMQGPVVYKKVLDDPSAAASLIPAGLGTSCESLHQSARIAYQRRVGKRFRDRLALRSEVKGIPWNEDTVACDYPEIARYYGRL